VYLVAVGSPEVEHVDGHDLVKRPTERTVDRGADTLLDLLVQLVVLREDWVLAQQPTGSVKIRGIPCKSAAGL
jgi:hypothetical protein